MMQKVIHGPADRAAGAAAHGDAPQPDQQRQRRADVLPASLPPRGLSRTQAAAYIGVSTSLFDQMVADGRMPGPKRINSRTVWDIKRLDAAFDALPDDNGVETSNPWDKTLTVH